MPNLADLLTRAASEHGDRIALKLDEQEANYAFLHEAAARVAGLLKAQAGSSRATASGSCSRTSRTSPSSTTACCAPAASWCR